MNTTKRPMRLTRDVKNPKFDRRCKHGVEAVETFTAGTFLVSYTHDESKDAEKFGEGHVEMGGRTHSFAMRDLLLDNAEPSDPRTAAEAMLLADIAGIQNADELVQQMIDMKLISLADIAAAGAALNAKWDTAE